MESRQTIKNRIKSIEGTRQITRSMRLVSMAKMQRAREHMKGNLPFLDESRRLAAIAKKCLNGERHPYINGRPVRNTMMVVISGDRGLCGGYNAGVIRTALRHLESLDHPAKVITIGSKVSDAFRRRQAVRPIHSFKGLTDSPIYAEVAEIAEIVRGLFDEGEVDEVMLCFTHFTSMLLQNPQIIRLLPIEEDELSGVAESYEPGGIQMLGSIVSFYLASRLYGAILESSVSEQSARILSMDGAVRTAGEMIMDLTLRYNQARQSVITQELTEIVSGADAISMEGSG
jgi:F-type H+-transporting ATPase subunit gamma